MSTGDHETSREVSDMQPHPLDLRWFVNICMLDEEHRCGSSGNIEGHECNGCLHNGFSMDLSTIRMVVSAHPDQFRERMIHGPDSPKPWDTDYLP